MGYKLLNKDGAKVKTKKQAWAKDEDEAVQKIKEALKPLGRQLVGFSRVDRSKGIYIIQNIRKDGKLVASLFAGDETLRDELSIPNVVSDLS